MSLHSGTGRPGDVHNVRERLEFNQKVQEQRLLAEERRDWDRVSPDRGQLQVNTGACQETVLFIVTNVHYYLNNYGTVTKPAIVVTVA
jgi:hypothetical protein